MVQCEEGTGSKCQMLHTVKRRDKSSARCIEELVGDFKESQPCWSWGSGGRGAKGARRLHSRSLDKKQRGGISTDCDPWILH